MESDRQYLIDRSALRDSFPGPQHRAGQTHSEPFLGLCGLGLQAQVGASHAARSSELDIDVVFQSRSPPHLRFIGPAQKVVSANAALDDRLQHLTPQNVTYAIRREGRIEALLQ